MGIRILLFRLVTLSCLLGGLILTLPAAARDGAPLAGSAIVPAFTLRGETHEPGVTARLVACITNDNPRSSRDVETGDRFTLTLGAGALLACESLDVHSPSAQFEEADFACDVSGSTLTLTFAATPRRWIPGDAVCAVVLASLPTSTTSVACRIDIRVDGAYASPQPAYLVVNIGADLTPSGPTGPTGPVGPVGPTGPTGPSGSGARMMVTSTAPVSPQPGLPPILVPGLSMSIVTAAGSSISVQVDAIAYNCAIVWGSSVSVGRLALSVDGAIVAQRDVGIDGLLGTVSAGSDRRDSLAIDWLSPPLAGGDHDLQVLVESLGAARTLCVGSAANDGVQARLIAVELKP